MESTNTVATNDLRINALLGSVQWASSGSQPVELTFSFPDAASVWSTAAGEYGAGAAWGPQTGFAPLSDIEKGAVRAALAAWAAVANIRFVETADNATVHGTLRFAWTASSLNEQSWAYGPGTSDKAGDIWLNSLAPWDGFAPGTYGFSTLVHEIGHALGLKHPVEGAVALPPAQDSYAVSLMSETAYAGAAGSWVDFEPTTPMLYDILAIQSLYGANPAGGNGDDIHVFTENQRYFQTLWDSGGNDTIVWQGQLYGARIDLNAGRFSQLGGPLTYWSNDFSSSWQSSDTVEIGIGVAIENAIGGDSNDTLMGNGLDNRLTGGAGSDTFEFAVTGNGVDTITDWGLSDRIVIESVNFTGPVTNGNGSSLSAGHLQIQSAGGVTHLYVGTDNVPGADVEVLLGGTWPAEHFAVSGHSIINHLNHLPTGAVTINGTPAQGQALSASNTLADADGLGLVSYQWQADGFDIAGASGSTFTPLQAQVGHLISVSARYTDGFGTGEQVSSSATAAVANVNDLPTGAVVVFGVPMLSQLLTASVSLADADGMGTISYQWKAAGIDIPGATGSSYTLTSAEVGKVVSVSASYTDGGGTLETVSSIPSAEVIAFNTFTGTPNNDSLIGLTGPDSILGLAGNDRLNGKGGTDTIDGGSGTDTLVLQVTTDDVLAHLNSLSYAPGSISRIGSSLGTVELLGVERVQLNDGLYAFDTSAATGNSPGGHVWQAAALYRAGFGFMPDQSALSHWTAEADTSASMGVLGQKIIDFYAPGISSASFVSYLYQMLLHEAPTPVVLQGLVSQIGNGQPFATQGDLFAYAASLSLNTDLMVAFAGSIQSLDASFFG